MIWITLALLIGVFVRCFNAYSERRLLEKLVTVLHKIDDHTQAMRQDIRDHSERAEIAEKRDRRH